MAFPNRCCAANADDDESGARAAALAVRPPNDDDDVFDVNPPREIPVGLFGCSPTPTPLAADPIGFEKKSSFISSCTCPSFPLLVLCTLSSSASIVNLDDICIVD